LGEDLRRDYNEDEAQDPYDGYDDDDDDAYRNAPPSSQSKLEESIEAISEQLRLMNQRHDRTERETERLAERHDRLELTTQQSLEETRDLINETRREAAENTDRAINRITEEVAKAIAAAQVSTQQSIRDVADQCQRQTEAVRVELRGEIRAMYEQLHEDVQTLHDSTESFKLHTWETTAELRHLIQGVVDRNANVPPVDSTLAATQPQFTPSMDSDQSLVGITPTTPACTPTPDTYVQRSLSEDEVETDTSLLRPKVIQLLDCLRQGYQKASSQLALKHSASSSLANSVEFMDELVAALAHFTNGEFLEVTVNKIAHTSRRTAAMKLFAKHLADRRPEMLQSLQQFVDAHEAIISHLEGDHSDHTMQRVIPHHQAQMYVEAWEAPFHFIQQAVRERTHMLSLTREAMVEQVSFNLLLMVRTPHQ
jgi:F0F1-type ATP synthase membrane subunit b/b'